MATDIVQYLFGVTPEMYQQQQAAAADERALAMSRLDPMQRAEFNIARGAYGLAGALGGPDPELQRISARQSIAKQIDFNDPASIQQAMTTLQQAGDIGGAMQLMQVADQARARQVLQAEQEQKALQLRQTQLAQRIAQGAYQPGGEEVYSEDIMGQRVGAGVTPSSYDIKRVTPELLALGAPGIAQLKAISEAQAFTQPKYEKAGDVWYKIEQGQAPVPIGGVFKKGEKLATRDAQGGWAYVSPTGGATPVAANENPIAALIGGKAIHATVLPYANQLARSFGSMDPEDQDKAMEKLTRINNDAVNTEANRGLREAQLRSSAQTAELSRELTQLRIEQAKRTAEIAQDGKPLPVPSIEKLSKQSDGVSKQDDLLSSFKDNFVGYKLNTIGNADIALSLRSDDPERLALGSWWQKYQENINKVRNDLFGAALTASEKTEFEKAMVTPGMSPQAARANLQLQAEAARKAYEKVTAGLVANGYSKSGIAAMSPYATMAPVAPGATPAAPAAAPTPLPGGATVRRVQ
jgi:hypothetical protein